MRPPSGPGGYLGFYDGSAGASESYEERRGLANSTTLTQWVRLTPNGPKIDSPYATGSFRYVDAVQVGDAVRLYYECARSDGSHELRVSSMKAAEITQ